MVNICVYLKRKAAGMNHDPDPDKAGIACKEGISMLTAGSSCRRTWPWWGRGTWYIWRMDCRRVKISYKNNSFPFRPLQAFFSFMPAAARRAGLTLRAFRGHTAMQPMQEMHFTVSVSHGSWAGMAPTGHFCAQRPQWTQAFPAWGFMGTPPYSR